MISAEIHSSHDVVFRRLMVAAEGGTGLVPLTRLAAHFAAPESDILLTDVVCNPARLFPTLLLNHDDWRDAHDAMIHGAQTTLAEAARRLAGAGAKAETDLIDLAALHRDATEALGSAARTWKADFIALSAHPRGHRWVCRLDPEELVAATRCPVLYVPAARLSADDTGIARVLVAIDGSGTALGALRVALSVLPADTLFRIVYVVDRLFGLRELFPRGLIEYDGERALTGAGALLSGRPVAAEAALIDTGDEFDDVPDAILSEAKRWHADLVVMGSRGRRNAAHIMAGRVAARALRETTCPMLVCPPLHMPGNDSMLASREEEAAVATLESPPLFL
jgi:nucleotide-binding universal stress UspA family protein